MAETSRAEEMARIRAAGDEELRQEIEQHLRAMLDLRMQAATGQLSDTMAIRNHRKTIARIKTVLRERELAAMEEE